MCEAAVESHLKNTCRLLQRISMSVTAADSLYEYPVGHCTLSEVNLIYTLRQWCPLPSSEGRRGLVHCSKLGSSNDPTEKILYAFTPDERNGSSSRNLVHIEYTPDEGQCPTQYSYVCSSSEYSFPLYLRNVS
jgi:hypothetical protein